jgi:LacI family transcriptional regulator
MRDVAAHAGVSLKTVSRVVNGEAGVRPATIAKVEAAVEALRFERNDVARSLRPGHRTQTLGLVIEDVANPYFAAITLGADQVAQAHGYLLITASAHADAERERELVTTLLRRRVDGLLLVPSSADHRYIARARADVETVFLDRPARNLEADAVLLDDVGGTKQAVAHLVAHGHRRIAFVGDESGVYTARRRLASFRRAMIARVGAVDEQLVVNGRGLTAGAEVEHAETAVRRLMSLPARRRPTAIFTNSNRVTVGALHALRGQPDRVALVGFDEVELGDLLGVTVVRSNPLEMGRIAAELTLERIHGRDDPPRRIVMPTELVPRGSGEIAG